MTVHCGKLVVHVHNGLTVVLPYISSKKYWQNNNVEYGVHYTLYYDKHNRNNGYLAKNPPTQSHYI